MLLGHGDELDYNTQASDPYGSHEMSKENGAEDVMSRCNYTGKTSTPQMYTSFERHIVH
jgi:hypothetical protein